MSIQRIQEELKKHNIDGWLLYDFHNRDVPSYRVLGLDEKKHTSRRWFYFIPAEGEPIKLAHSVEPTKLDALPGKKVVYLPWVQLHKELKDILGSPKKIAMQYSPNNEIPYISIVDAGTIELIRSFGHTIVSSADLIQTFEALIDEKSYKLMKKANELIYSIKDEAFDFVHKTVYDNKKLKEHEIADFILKRIEEEGMVSEGTPITGVNDHPADPHFEPTKENSYYVKKGDALLMDLWGKIDTPGGIFCDITWCGFIGDNPPAKYIEMFDTVMRARDAAVDFVTKRFEKGEPCYGWEVDDACRNVVKSAGYGDYFVHRTGHSIGEEVHGNGAHIDNLETKDNRQIVPGILFSVEPGIYIMKEKLAVRTEIDVFINYDGKIEVTGPMQKELVLLK